MSRVAIVMPYYQEKLLLTRTLMGILNQTFSEWRLFLVDDGSSPENKARNVLSKQLDDRIEIIEKPNGGVSSARNMALDVIRNRNFEYVAFCDSDDIWERNYLQSQLGKLAEGYDVTYSKVSVVFPDGKPAVVYGIADYDEFPGVVSLIKGNFIYASSVVCRAECLSVGNFDPALDSIEDWDMWTRMAEAGYRFVKNKNTSIAYICREGSMAGKSNAEKYNLYNQKHQKYLDTHQTPVTAISVVPHRNIDEVTAMISTKDRFFTTLPMAISSVATQTVRPKKLLIFDDSEKHEDLRQVSPYDQLFRLLDAKGIEWEVRFGHGVGQVANHQNTLESATTEFVWRLDDDNVAEPDALAGLLGSMKADVGAVGGLVLHPPHIMFLSKEVGNKIEDIYDGRNAQWFHHPKRELMEVDHLYSTFLYRREAGIKAGGYCKELSPAGHREETMFTYSLKKAGYRVLVNPNAVTWHLKASTGGIRGYQPQNWEKDEHVFSKFLAKHGIHPRQTKWIVLDNGLGDHLMFKQILPEIKKKYANDRLVFAVCYPEVFENEGVDLISIGEAMATLGTNLDQYNIYKWCIDHQWKTSMVDAFRSMYL